MSRTKQLIEEALVEHEDEVMREASRAVTKKAMEVATCLHERGVDRTTMSHVHDMLTVLAHDFRHGPSGEVTKG